jgi:transcriptional regulator with XRE-family HTH domain
MKHTRLATYLRSHRKRSGLSQNELAALLGYPGAGEVSRHERSNCVPPFLSALGYEAVFKVSASQIFPGMYESIVAAVETRLKELETKLLDSKAPGRRRARIARKLEWMWERNNLEQSELHHGIEPV